VNEGKPTVCAGGRSHVSLMLREAEAAARDARKAQVMRAE
jgi:hypothetical protein